MARRSAFTAVAIMALVLAACSPQEAELTTTTTVVATSEVTSTVPASTTTTVAEDSSTTTSVQAGVPDYEVMVRSSTTRGEVLWVLVEPDDYTDIDLENLIRVMVADNDATLDGINVFDDAAALEAGRVDEAARTADEQALVDEHFLVSLVDGAIIRYEGPYSDLGDVAVGS